MLARIGGTRWALSSTAGGSRVRMSGAPVNGELKKTKVLIIAPAPPLVGGQAVQARRLVDSLRREPHLVVDLQPNNPYFAPRLQQIRFVRTLLTTLRYLLDIMLKIPRYDVVHVFSASYWTFVYSAVPALLIAKSCGKKAILNYRSGEAGHFFSTWGRPFLPFVRWFDHVVAPSGYLVDVFRGFNVKAQSISNFVSLEKYTRRDRVPLRPVFLSNRILEPLYNIDCILRAFQIIQRKYPDARLVVAHEGPDRPRLEKLSLDLQLSNVQFIGLVPNDRIAECYNSVDIYLNSPNMDCMPGSLIECLASGLPIVSTDAGGIPYICENEKTALLVAVNDHEALAASAMRLLEDDVLARTIIKNGLVESRKYSWEHVRGRWLEMYQS